MGQPLQISAGPHFEAELLAGPGACGAYTGAADRSIDLLGRHAGEQHPAAWAELGRDVELVAPHQPPGRMQQGQFAAAIGLPKGPLHPQRRRGAALMLGATIGGAAEAQLRCAMPCPVADHSNPLNRAHFGGSCFRESALCLNLRPCP